ncbi:NADPH-dependent 7-cyano-7-deazaguanine reductase QueF [Oceanobacter kriegii]|uniref:NADPH-dependent 7-cyano-7-deazaguanine reductase QueF n=1 Tax=Oceanobacter kriegii TaxID=64972 RepID=UPI0003FB162B|nr:NADPH-dependent 7-cyano-7-deazaguanine reductase QueF [Oceanobacter kriegii]
MATIDSVANPLGKVSEYKDEYDASLLFPIPRAEGRKDIAYDADAVYGEDIWNGFEVSWLNGKGKPVVRIGEFRLPSGSPNIIESKSFKLYLNSFNQTRFLTEEQVQEAMEFDLSKAAGGAVRVVLHPVDHTFDYAPDAFCIDELDIEVADYAPNADLLIADQSDDRFEGWLCSHLLKSNCPVTGQPDWGSLYIKFAGERVCQSSLLAYVISMRQHQGFHEQCVERIYSDLMQRFALDELIVCARYVRRGGLDINPVRSNKPIKGFPNFRLARQ